MSTKESILCVSQRAQQRCMSTIELKMCHFKLSTLSVIQMFLLHKKSDLKIIEMQTEHMHTNQNTSIVYNNINQYLTNGFAHHYHLGEPTFIFRGVMADF